MNVNVYEIKTIADEIVMEAEEASSMYRTIGRNSFSREVNAQLEKDALSAIKRCDICIEQLRNLLKEE